MDETARNGALANEWLQIDQDAATTAEIATLLQQHNTVELQKRLDGRLIFGTAGLRAAMGAGWTRMNSVTVILASQGLASFLVSQGPEAATKGVVIGHDARFNSREFAAQAAATFIAKGIRVHLFDKLVHTPLVPFAVSYLGAAAGVMVTASHNPANDNGYKVYWSNGCQIVPPLDEGIAKAIEQEGRKPRTWSLDRSSPLLTILDDRVEEAYCAKASRPLIEVTVPPFVYTPMHGVGLPFLRKVLSQSSRSSADAFHVVPEQAEPDPNFSTVKFPNPEETGALDLAIRDADKLGQTLIIANDPDADRFAVAEKVPPIAPSAPWTWHQFTGNEVGILLASHVLETHQQARQAGKLTMLASTVSSAMLKYMAAAEGFDFVETLTGFKWLGNVAQQLTSQGLAVPFAFEEALGYMFTDVVWDKDGIAAAASFLAAVVGWSKQGMTPSQKLLQLYQKYGFFVDANTYLVSPSPQVTNLTFMAIRAISTEQIRPYPSHLGPDRILRWRDLTVGYDSATEDNKPELPIDSKSQMITCELEGDVRFTVRGSGTEPKIKLYVEGRGGSFEEARAKAVRVQRLIIEQWFNPDRYGLREPS